MQILTRGTAVKTAIVFASFLAVSLNAFATTIAFESGVGGCGVMNSGDTFINQCVGAGVTGAANDYFYVDARDTFDGQGISSHSDPGQLFFAAPVNNLSIDYVLLPGTNATFNIYDAAHTLLATFAASAGGAAVVDASHSFGGTGIAELDFFSGGGNGVTGISTVTFNSAAAVPEPATLTLVGGALAGLAWKRRRRNR
jgi:PEP-CTERM motif